MMSFWFTKNQGTLVKTSYWAVVYYLLRLHITSYSTMQGGTWHDLERFPSLLPEHLKSPGAPHPGRCFEPLRRNGTRSLPEVWTFWVTPWHRVSNFGTLVKTIELQPTLLQNLNSYSNNLPNPCATRISLLLRQETLASAPLIHGEFFLLTESASWKKLCIWEFMRRKSGFHRPGLSSLVRCFQNSFSDSTPSKNSVKHRGWWCFILRPLIQISQCFPTLPFPPHRSADDRGDAQPDWLRHWPSPGCRFQTPGAWNPNVKNNDGKVMRSISSCSD